MKTALITGASHGIGKAAARQLAPGRLPPVFKLAGLLWKALQHMQKN